VLLFRVLRIKWQGNNKKYGSVWDIIGRIWTRNTTKEGEILKQVQDDKEERT
jgi:hypothetical protein